MIGIRRPGSRSLVSGFSINSGTEEECLDWKKMGDFSREIKGGFVFQRLLNGASLLHGGK